MNHTYRLVWSEAARCYVPAPETARGRGKSKSRKALAPVAAILGAALSLPALAQTVAPDALPSGGQVVHGQASISQSGSQMTVQQGSDKAILNWNSFDIGKDASVQFQQHKNSDIALNRVIAGGASQIEGKLSANGQVWLVNPNGVVFGNGSQVDVGGLVASTLNILDKDFLDGKAVFTRDGATGGIVNQGKITAKEGGYIAMLAPTVSNDGILIAKLGTVAMAAGDKVTLEAGVNGLLQVEVESATLDTLVQNKQLIVADGGQVVMTGKAANALASSVVANTGTVQARTLQEREGRILLLADMDSGTTQVSGMLDASAPNGGDGGFIETSAARVKVAEGARVTTLAADGKGKTGTWLIDPTDFTISAGGAAQTGSGIGADTLSSNLNDNNVILETAAADTGSEAGDINVDADVGWNASTTLTLTAHNDVNINASINASNGGSLTINAAGAVSASGNVSVDGTFTLQSGNWTQNGALPAFSANDFRIASGASFLRAASGDGSAASPYQIADVYGLQGMASASLLGYGFALTGNIDASGTAGWNNGAGFVPIGGLGANFTGSFDGGNHVISGLAINRPGESYVGLFGFTRNATIQGVGLTNGSIVAYSHVGGLAGYSDTGGSIVNSYNTGAVTGSFSVGGLVGRNNGDILDSYATGAVAGISEYIGGPSGNDSMGGLVGANYGNISTSHASGDVTTGAFSSGGSIHQGGLVGFNIGNIQYSYATGNVIGHFSVGGLVGGNYSSIDSSYATGAASGNMSVGGLAGINNGSISGSYALGAATGNGNVGGLVGSLNGSISGSYAIGTATGSANVGGLVGSMDSGSFSGTLWNNETNANAIGSSPGVLAGLGRTLAQFRQLSTFVDVGWDIDDAGGTGKTWRIYDGHTTPLLRHFLTSLTVSATPDYDGSGTALSNIASVTVDMAGADASRLFGSVAISGGDTLTLSSTAAGEYIASSNASINGGLYSDQQGYDISYGSVVSRTIATSGTAAGDIHLTNPITWLNGTLAIETTGTVTALGAISGGAGSTFKLVNGTWVENAGGGALPGFSVQDFQLTDTSATFLRVLDGDGGSANPYQIADVYGLQGMASSSLLGSHFALANDIAASTTVDWNSSAGFASIGGGSGAFTGVFNGGNHVISGLAIYRPTEDLVGLFGLTQGATIQNVGLTNGSVIGFSNVGGLVGNNDAGSNIINSYNTGAVAGSRFVGGLAGRNNGGIAGSYTTGAVTGTREYIGGPIGNENIGGLVGYNGGVISFSHASGNVNVNGSSTQGGGLVGYNAAGATIADSHASGDVTAGASTFVGGLAGDNAGSIQYSYATGSVLGQSFIGGLAGRNSGSIDSSYATGNASGDTSGGGGASVGGLVGTNSISASISNSYAAGAASGNVSVGGLVGSFNGTITGSYATGAATGNNYVGGLVGYLNGGIGFSLWNNEANANAAGSLPGAYSELGRTSAQLQQLSTFADLGWDIDDAGGTGKLWRIYDGHTTPLLRHFLTAVTLDAIPDYDGSGTALSNIASVSADTTGVDASHILGSVNGSGGDTLTLSSTAAGGYTATSNASMSGGGLYSDQQGYDISYGSVVSRTIATSGTAAGDIHLTNPITWLNGTLAIDTTGTVSAVGAISGGAGSTFKLVRGAWAQHAGGGVLPGFSVQDFQLTSASATFLRVLGGDGGSADPYQIADIYGLQGMASSSLLASSFVLANDIDAGGTAGWNSGAGFVPIGEPSEAFTGVFNGGNYIISGLTLYRPSEDYVGLFGFTRGATIQDVGLANGSVIGYSHVGGLAGYSGTGGSIINSYNTGVVAGSRTVGGLVGDNFGGIAGSYTTGAVAGTDEYLGTGESDSIGGLVGVNYGSISASHASGDVSVSGNGANGGGLAGYNATGATIADSHASGNVTAGASSDFGSAYLGGLVGGNDGSIQYSYASGNVIGHSFIGGLAGVNSGSIDSSYAAGNAIGDTSNANTGSFVGGLVGYSYGGVSNSYATGAASGRAFVGGLVGVLDGGITGSYATGAATGSNYLGGLVGSVSSGSIINSFWNNEANANAIGGSPGALSDTGKTLTQLRQLSTFTELGWDIDDAGGTGKTWRIYDGHTTPLLRHFLTSVTLNATPDYDGSGTALANIASVSVDTSGVDASHLFGSVAASGDDTLTLSSTAAGEYTATSNAILSGLYSDQQGYDISYGSEVSRTIATSGTAAGDIDLTNPITWLNGTLAIDTAGTVTATGAISGGAGSAFKLVNGTWVQNAGGGTLPGFSVQDFQLTSASATFLRVLGGDGGIANPYQIADVYGLQGMASSSLLDSSFALANDIAASGTAGWNGGAGFASIGGISGAFTGSFDGDYYVISGLAIYRPSEEYVGLFGLTQGATIENVGLENGSVIGDSHVGGLVGSSDLSLIIDSYNTGTVTGGHAVGGLVGSNGGIIAASYATGTVTGSREYAGGPAGGDNIGGLVGLNDGGGIVVSYATGNVDVSGSSTYGGGLVGYNTDDGIIIDSYASGMTAGAIGVDGSTYLGGLVGGNAGVIQYSYATGSVMGQSVIGGLVGGNSGSIDLSYATGNVTGDTSISGAGSNIGGLVGSNTGSIGTSYATGVIGGHQSVGGLVGSHNGSIADSYAIGAAAGNDYVGGLVGYMSHGSITGSYATGAATGSTNVGGLAGFVGDGSIDLSLWNNETNANGIGSSPGELADFGRTLAQLRQLSTFTELGWDIDDEGGTGKLWRIYDGHTTPLLRDLLAGATVNVASSASKTYDGTAGSGTLAASDYTVTPDCGCSIDMSLILGSLGYATSGANAGSYALEDGSLQLSGLYSGQQGYDISYAGAADYTIDKAALIITASDVTKTYDGTTSANGTAVAAAGYQLFGDDSLSGGSFAFDDKNAGAGKTVSVSGVTIDDGNNGGNYDVTYVVNTNSTIDKLAITGAITADNKTYDGTTAATTHGSLVGVLAGDDLSVDSTSGSFEDKNAGTGKTVNVAGTVTGADTGNYDVAFNDTTTADIAKLAISGSIVADNKTYDGTTNATTHGSLNGVIAGDDLSVASTSGSFEDKNTGVGKTVNVAGAVAGADANNYDVAFNSTATADISKLAITGTITADNKTYDGTTSATTQGSLNGVITGDDISVASTSGSFEDKNAGSGKTVNVGGVVVGADAGNYDVVFNDATTADIAKLSISGAITADNKTYDGTTAVTTHGSLSGVLADDDLSVASTSGSFEDKNAGTGKTVNVAGTVAGADAGNYEVAFNDTTTADIAKLAITGAITADNKTYDATTSATTHGSLNGVIAGDELTATATGSFDDKNAGIGKIVNVAGTVAGADAGNYDVVFNDTTTADIAKLAISGTITADNKTYDGTTAATTHGNLTGVLAGDDLSVLSTSGSFEDKNAGTGKTVNVAGTVAGADVGNYEVAFNDATTADIAKLAITGTITADGKIYDGTISATTHGSLNGVLAGDDVAVTSTNGSFDDKNAGTDKAVNVTGAVAGADAGNYDIVFNGTTTADIAKLAIAGTITANNKTYDGTTNATTHGNLNGVIIGDDLSVASTSGSFDDKNAGTGKTVSVAGTVEGADTGNYEVAFNDTTTADIAKLVIAGTITADSKVYDGTTSATTQGNLNGVITGDDISVASTSGSFEDKNAGSGKTVNVGGVVAGVDAGNYDVVFNDATTADIAKLAISGVITADNKTYDGTTAVTTHGSLTGVLADDDLSVASTSGSFEDKHAGTGKTVNVAGAVAGADAGNYEVTFNDTTTADIAKLTITGAITADGKTYDGTINATTHGSLSGILAGDDLSIASSSGSFSDKNAGTSKTVAVVGTVAGADASNYDVVFNSTTTADISKLAITGTITADNKTYDGTISATTHGSLDGVIAGDDLTAATIGSFDDKNVGNGKTVNVAGTLEGVDAGNYDVEFNSVTTADIARLAITGAITADGKTYDGTTSATTHGSLNGVLAGDDISVASTSGSFEDKHAGTGKTVSVAATVAGADAGNYEVAFNDATTADIAKLAITGAIVADGKVYDGTMSATTHGSLNGVIAGDDLAATTSGSFEDKNAGTDKTVNVVGTVAGADAGNYEVVFNDTTTADIAKLVISGVITADNKVYDGTTIAATHGSLTGVLAGDELSIASSNGSFSDKNAGAGKTVNVAGTVAGADAGNYDVAFNSTTTADISKLVITGTITADGKIYDGTTSVTTHGSLNGVLAGDDLTAATTGSFEDKNAGASKMVNVAGTVMGVDAGNYEVAFNDATTADIAKLVISGVITADNKTYDGTINATTHGSLSGVLTGDDLSISGSHGSFGDKNAGAGKVVNVAATVVGADAGNYEVLFNGTTTADIAKLAITGAILADGKVYDGTTDAVTHGHLNGVITGDDIFVVSTSGSFEDKNAGIGKTVNVDGTVSGTDAGNYDVVFNDAAMADIAKLGIVGVIAADGKVYDGTMAATTHGNLNGVITGDDISVTSTSGSFEDKNAGTGKTVTVAGVVAGSDAGNYEVVFNDTTTADIAKLVITGTITADGKVYDGTTAAVTHGSLHGVIAGDDLTATTAGSFDDKNAGTGKTVNVAGTVAGADAGNYEIAFNDTTTADIAKLAITGTITADNKTYDGTTSASTHGSLNGVLAGDDIAVTSTNGSFEDKNANTGKTVNVAGAVAGVDVGNYDVVFNDTTTADIAKLAISGAITADNKTYDGTTSAITHGSLTGVLAGDDLSIASSNGSFSDKNAGIGKIVNVAGTVTGVDAGNYEVAFNDATTADIAKLAISGSITADNRTYDSTINATTHGSLHGVIAGDDLTAATTGSFEDKNAGIGKTVNVAGTVAGTDADNYDVTFNSTTTADISKLAIAGVIVADGKVYDGTTGATTHGSLSGVIAGDDLSISGTNGSFGDKNAGTGKTVSVAGTVVGADADNYEVAFNDATTADIAKLAISGTITAENKVYDGTTSAITHGSLTGVLAGDDLSIASSNGSFSDKNAGAGKTVNVSGIVAGADAGNYDVVFNDATAADIAKLSITGVITADNRTYDGTINATTHGSLNGVIEGDDLTAATSGSFEDKHAGSGKTVNVAGTVAGADMGNYEVAFNDATTADIAKLAISGTITADGKIYDGTTNVTTHGNFNGVIEGDDLTAMTTGSFDDKNAGTGKIVNVAGTAAGADAGNYEVAFNDATTADIAKLVISGAITAGNKTYDGTTAAMTHGSLAGVLAGDDLSVLSTSGSFEDKNAGTGKTVNVAGTITGVDAGNYDVVFNDTTTADIAKLGIVGVITADGKVYDGTTFATTHGSLNGVIAGDDLSISSTNGSFGDKNAGTSKTVSVAGTVVGADAGNYDVAFNSTTTADISKLVISGAIIADNKTYDGTTAATTYGSLTGVLAGDDLSVLSTSGSFEDKNAGTGKTVNVLGTVLGADASNYDVVFNSTTTADISKLAITGTITADNKIYDGTTNATTHGSLNGVITGDEISVTSTSGSFEDKTAGAGKTVNVAGTVAGVDAGNYEVAFNDATTADIAKLAISGSIVADNKTYDGTTAATTHGSLTGVLADDDLSVASTSGSFEDKNAGTGKTVNVSGTVVGADAGNYDVVFNDAAMADIAKLAIAGTITADGKVYDGTTSATTHGSLNGVIAGDDLTATTVGSFDDKNAGTGKTVSVAGTAVGADAGNYEVAFNDATTADIAKLAISGSITADNRTYDSTINATTHGNLNGVIAGDDLTAVTTGSFDDKNAGTGKTVNVAGTVAGVDASNYDVAFNSTTTADISKLAITGVITADGKVYDSTTSVTTHGSLNGVLAGDDLIAATTGSFEDKNAGVGKTVNVSGIAVGADAGNYEVAFNDTTMADIAKLVINGVITADSKTYDGTINAITHGGLNGVLTGDDLSISSTNGSFDDKNAGTNKTVNVAGTVTGADAGNYDVVFNDAATADIAKLVITGTITADGKIYDGTASATTHGSLNGVISGDDLTVTTAGDFEDRNAGIGKTVNVAGSVSGADAGNYSVAFNATATAAIDRAALTITANDAWKSVGNELAFLGTEFTTGQGQLKNGEAVTAVQLASEGSPASAQAGNYAITASNALGANGFNESNYSIAYVDGNLTVAASPTPTPTVAVLSGESLWRDLAPSLEPAGSQFAPSEQEEGAQTKSKEIPQLTLAPGYIRLDE